MRLFLAFRVFFVVLFRRDSALRVREALEDKLSDAASGEIPNLTGPVKSTPIPSPSSAAKLTKSTRRSEALTLLSALQRESRLLDLVCESLDQYNDAQIGAAARDVLRDTRKTLDRIFGLQHLVDSSEGESIEIPNNASPVRWRIIGQESLNRGTLSHPGWQATKVDMPQWSGGPDDSLVIAAAEIEN